MELGYSTPLPLLDRKYFWQEVRKIACKGVLWHQMLRFLSSLQAESARAVSGRRCPHSKEEEDILKGATGLFYENCCNSGTEGRKIDPKVGN